MTTLENPNLLSAMPRNEFLVIWLSLCLGLRKGEIAQTRWRHLTQTGIDAGPGEIRNKKDRGTRLYPVRVTAIEPFWSVGWRRIQADGWESADPNDYVLSGSDEERTDDVFRRVSALMIGCGWTTQKKSHALRALAGAWITQRFKSPYMAQIFLRHSSVMVTEQHYNALLAPGVEPDEWAKRIEWATGRPSVAVIAPSIPADTSPHSC